MTFREAAEVYYQPTVRDVYGYATRYGSDEVAFRELVWEARQVAEQARRGYVLPGGGYGYFEIDGSLMLLENRSSPGYALLADDGERLVLTENQLRLLALSEMSIIEVQQLVYTKYVGIISGRSPNDIGGEFCLYDLAVNKVVGLVIVGGTAARNDYIYYGPSVNDEYGHERLGVRAMKVGSRDYYWIADLSDSVHGRLAVRGKGSARLIGLMDGGYCDGG